MKEGDLIEDMFGRFEWPVAAVVLIIVAALLYSSVDAGSNKAQLRKEIITACADKTDVPTCINNLKKNLP